MEENENKKEIEIVSGDGSNLDISPVYEDVNTLRPKSNDKKPKDIVIPEPKKNKIATGSGFKWQ